MLIELIILLLILGVVLWAIEALIPMDPTIKRLIYLLIAVVVIIWLLRAFGVVGGNLGLG